MTTQEEKQLLLKDLCTRLLYGVIVKNDKLGIEGKLLTVSNYQPACGYILTDIASGNQEYTLIEDIKPYLRPMSSMTENERLEYEKRSNGDHEQCYELRANGCDRLEILEQDAYTAAFDLEWLNENHFDYRRLIEKGLALEAPEGMYKIE